MREGYLRAHKKGPQRIYQSKRGPYLKIAHTLEIPTEDCNENLHAGHSFTPGGLHTKGGVM